MVYILRLVRVALLPFLSVYQPIMLFDAAPQHTTPLVLRSSRRMQLWPCVVPAKETFLLQPLDTHVFASFKRCLARLHHSAHVMSVDGEVTFAAFLQCVCQAIEEIVVQRSWAHAFECNGFGVLQAGLSERVRSELGLGGLGIKTDVGRLHDVAVGN